VNDFAAYWPDLAIFNVNRQAPVEPIISFVGLLAGDKTHDPDFDHVLRPVEFDEAISDKFFVALSVSDDTFHVTVVDVAAATEPAVTPPNNPATVNTPTRKIALDLMSQHYNTPQRPRNDTDRTDRLGIPTIKYSSRCSEKCDDCASVALYTESARFQDTNSRTLPPLRYRCRVIDDHETATRRTLPNTLTVFLSGQYDYLVATCQGYIEAVFFRGESTHGLIFLVA
jgi:hypothetical protein